MHFEAAEPSAVLPDLDLLEVVLVLLLGLLLHGLGPGGRVLLPVLGWVALGDIGVICALFRGLFRSLFRSLLVLRLALTLTLFGDLGGLGLLLLLLALFLFLLPSDLYELGSLTANELEVGVSPFPVELGDGAEEGRELAFGRLEVVGQFGLVNDGHGEGLVSM